MSRSGCDDYLAKPVKLDELAGAVARFLRNPLVQETPSAAASDGASSEIGGVLASKYFSVEDRNRLLKGFVDGLAERIGKIEAALAAHDVDSLIQMAPRLKGAAGLYGYARLAELALQVEMQAREGRGSGRGGGPGKRSAGTLQRNPSGIPECLNAAPERCSLLCVVAEQNDSDPRTIRLRPSPVLRQSTATPREKPRIPLKHPGGQHVGRIVVHHRHGLLQNHRAVIVLVVDEVDGAPAQLDAVVDCRLMHMMSEVAFSAERRHQRRVDVDDTIAIVVRHDEQLEPTRQHDQFGARLAAGRKNGLTVSRVGTEVLRTRTWLGAPASAANCTPVALGVLAITKRTSTSNLPAALAR